MVAASPLPQLTASELLPSLPFASTFSAVTSLSVRTSWDLLLSTLVSEGDDIIMTGINISTMVLIASAHNVKIKVADVDVASLKPDWEAVAGMIGPRTKAILVAHVFGVTVDLRPLAAICASKNVLLISDAAESYDPVECDENMMGDVTFFSFGLIKPCTAVSGAVTVVKDNQRTKGIAAAIRRKEVRRSKVTSEASFGGCWVHRLFNLRLADGTIYDQMTSKTAIPQLISPPPLIRREDTGASQDASGTASS